MWFLDLIPVILPSCSFLLLCGLKVIIKDPIILGAWTKPTRISEVESCVPRNLKIYLWYQFLYIWSAGPSLIHLLSINRCISIQIFWSLRCVISTCALFYAFLVSLLCFNQLFLLALIGTRKTKPGFGFRAADTITSHGIFRLPSQSKRRGATAQREEGGEPG